MDLLIILLSISEFNKNELPDCWRVNVTPSFEKGGLGRIYII